MVGVWRQNLGPFDVRLVSLQEEDGRAQLARSTRDICGHKIGPALADPGNANNRIVVIATKAAPQLIMQ